MTQVDRAISALLAGWLSPKQLTAVSGRANPEGIRRDSKRAAFRRGLWWHEKLVVPLEGKSYKATMVTRHALHPGMYQMDPTIRTIEPEKELKRRRLLPEHLVRTESIRAAKQLSLTEMP